MIVYNVTVNIEQSAHDEWLEWMRQHHIPEVMKTGMFSEHRILRVLGDEESGGATYSFQYTCESMEKFRQYQEKYAPKLQSDHNEKFKDRFVAFRTLLETI
jgi:hypothetical protein